MKKFKKMWRLFKFLLILTIGKLKFEGFTTEIKEQIDDDAFAKKLYEIYLKAFERSKYINVQDQICFDLSSFKEALNNIDYVKYLIYFKGKIIGFSIATKDIENCQIAYAQPEFFRRKYPNYCEKKLCWYVPAIVILPDKQSNYAGLFLLQTMVKHAYENKAIINFDFAGSTTFLPILIRLAGKNVGVPIKGKRLDTQTYFELTCPHYKAD